ncbi:hypothetical protein PHLCEN_2v6290 [Hermanssonia centrifuga]|uniref:F-box domain-containing protein n=1 Tax=Hermanssonia centrifuga TaxID=98765 RepID=A0A2R6NZZ3_9APHY|nr:hypothetical protein PHLCEN_2v6290 [Hermanssonia centrifuga]
MDLTLATRKGRRRTIRLPIEIMDFILDNVDDFSPIIKPNLIACSLVSREWRQTVLPHLFRELTFTHRDYMSASPEENEDSTYEWADPKDIFSSFLSFLHSPPNVGNYIRQLCLGRYLQFLDAAADRERDAECDPIVLLDILCMLPKLCVLELHGVLFRPDAVLPAWDATSLINLNSLTLSLPGRETDANTTTHLIDLLKYFGQVKELHLKDIVEHDAPAVAAHRTLSLSHLRIQSLHFQEAPCVVSSLLEYIGFPRHSTYLTTPLESLIVEPLRGKDLATLQNGQELLVLDLTPCTNIRSLAIKCSNEFPVPVAQQLKAIDRISSMLILMANSSASLSIETVTLTIEAHISDETDALLKMAFTHLSPIERALVQLGVLVNVHIIICTNPFFDNFNFHDQPDEQIKMVTDSLFPELHERSKLKAVRMSQNSWF